MTPTLPTRARRRGMSVSFGRGLFLGLDRGEDCLNRNSSVGDELPTRAPRRGGEWRRPQVFPNQHPGSASWVHGGGQMRDVFLGQQLRQLRLELLEGTKVTDVGKFHRIHG